MYLKSGSALCVALACQSIFIGSASAQTEPVEASNQEQQDAAPDSNDSPVDTAQDDSEADANPGEESDQEIESEGDSPEAAATEPEPEPVQEVTPPDKAPITEKVQAPSADSEAEKKVKPQLTDHEQVVGTFGLGFIDSVQVRHVTTSLGTQTFTVPLIGGRYWLSERLALQAGVGFAHSSGVAKDETPGETDTPNLTQWSWGLHLSVPLSVYDSQHFNFLVVPLVNGAYSTGRTKDNENFLGEQAFDRQAFTLSPGVEVGAEVQFGFMGMPELSLQGSFGLSATYQSAVLNTYENDQEISRNRQWVSGGTAQYNDPWDIFIGSVSALYYFGL